MVAFGENGLFVVPPLGGIAPGIHYLVTVLQRFRLKAVLQTARVEQKWTVQPRQIYETVHGPLGGRGPCRDFSQQFIKFFVIHFLSGAFLAKTC